MVRVTFSVADPGRCMTAITERRVTRRSTTAKRKPVAPFVLGPLRSDDGGGASDPKRTGNALGRILDDAHRRLEVRPADRFTRFVHDDRLHSRRDLSGRTTYRVGIATAKEDPAYPQKVDEEGE